MDSDYKKFDQEPPKEPLDQEIEVVRKKVTAGMKNSADLILDDYSVNGVKLLLIMFDGLVSNQQVSDFLLRTLEDIPKGENSPEKLWKYLSQRRLMSSEAKTVTDYRTLFSLAMSGFAVVVIDGVAKALSLGYQGFATRSVGEPAAEKNLRGSREGFTESNNTNTALVRRRLKSPDFMVENLTIGTVSQTNVRLLYLNGVADPRMIDAIRGELMKAKMPVLLDSGYLEPFLAEGRRSFFGGTGVTQRPDTLAAKLVEGRCGIMVDGSPYVLVSPYLFMEHFQSLDDYTERPYFAAFVRILKLISFFLTIFLPGIYVAVVSFHPELIPRALLGSFLQSVSATPMPVMAEALVLFLIYELLREAGLRLPDAIGHTLSVVGGIVLGDAAVSAGLVGLPLMIIIALTAVCSFVIPTLYEAVTVLRFFFILIGGLLGLYGIFLGFLLLLVDLCSLESQGVPVTMPIAPIKVTAFRDLFWRESWKKLQNKTFSIAGCREKEENQNGKAE